MQKRFSKRIVVQQSSEQVNFGLLHLRRGDAIDECDTSVDRMQEYFACSLNRTETLGRNITMLLTTDEEDVGYRKILWSCWMIIHTCLFKTLIVWSIVLRKNL
jgi:hypothetical protein